MAVLPIDYLDDILAESMNGKRKFRITRSDGTFEEVIIEDVSEYLQTGSTFGAGDINRTNQTVNEKFDSGDVVDPMLTTEPGFAADAYKTKLQFDEQNKNLGYEIGSLNLKGTEHCTVTNFRGDYIKIGKLVFINIMFDIAGDGVDSDMYIDCLPYTSKYIDNFNLGYTNAIFKEPSNNKVFTSFFAGTWGNTTSMYLGGSLDGRNWIFKGNDCATSGSINISGFYKISE